MRHWPLLYGLNIYRFQIQIFIHTFESDVPKVLALQKISDNGL